MRFSQEPSKLVVRLPEPVVLSAEQEHTGRENSARNDYNVRCSPAPTFAIPVDGFVIVLPLPRIASRPTTPCCPAAMGCTQTACASAP